MRSTVPATLAGVCNKARNSGAAKVMLPACAIRAAKRFGREIEENDGA